MKRLLLITAVLLAAPAAAEDKIAGFTAAQADHGQGVYLDKCATCHGADLQSGEFAPSLKGARFRRTWGGQNAAALYGFVSRTMPPGQAGALSPDDYADVLAYVLSANGTTAGPEPFPTDAETQGELTLPR